MLSKNLVTRFLKFLKGGFAPDLTLLENWLFRLAVIIPIGAAAYLVTSYDLLKLGNEQVGIYEQLVYLWQHEKLTVLIAGLSFPLGAIAASHLRSLQASTQIKQQREQNIFNNHFKHLEEFDNAIEIADVRKKFRLKATTNQIHSIMFPKSTDGDYNVSENVVSNVNKSLELITEFLALAQKTPLTHRVIENLSKNLKASTKEIIGEHSVNLPIVDLNKYEYAKTLCLRYLKLHRNICEFASFYSRNSIIEINEKNIRLSTSLNNTLDGFIDQEKTVDTRISSSVQELRSAKSRDALNYAIVSKCHHAIVQELEGRNLDVSYYYPYEEIIKYTPSVKSEIIHFLEETAPEDTKILIRQKIHPQ